MGQKNNKFRNNSYIQNKELFDAASEVRVSAFELLKDFNLKKIQLADLVSCKRIFLFFLTRALKTYSAIYILCQEGYGQDVCPLLRSLLENLVSVKYILYDRNSANEKALRFVEYKWVIFKRYLSEHEQEAGNKKDDGFYRNRKLIIEKLNEFKQKYKIISDRTLLTWSGKTIKDMARAVSKYLLKEYESAFRSDSKFSHASIIGDREYLNFINETMNFSSLPSTTAVVSNLKRAVTYLLDFLRTFNDLFCLRSDECLKNLEQRTEEVFKMSKYNEDNSAISNAVAHAEFRKMSVKFEVALS